MLAGSVAERTQEIGVRSALGATRANILKLVVGQGMTLTGFGMLVGLAGAAAVSQVIVAMLFGVSHLDPMTYLALWRSSPPSDSWPVQCRLGGRRGWIPRRHSGRSNESSPQPLAISR
jgi:ABC-type antimicrobial peptide transport system permease subunit